MANRISIEVLVGLVVEKGNEMEQMKSGWIKVQGKQGRRIYIRLQQTVNQVDLAGWGENASGPGEFLEPAARPSGAVTRQILFAKHDLKEFVDSLAAIALPTEAPGRKPKGSTRVTLDSVLASVLK
jgi:hypothetical protein